MDVTYTTSPGRPLQHSSMKFWRRLRYAKIRMMASWQKKNQTKKNRAIAFKTTKRGSFFFPSFVCPPQVFRWMVRLMLQAGSLSLTQLYPSKLKEPSFHRSAFTHSVNHSFSWSTLKFLKGSRKQLPFCNLSSKITN